MPARVIEIHASAAVVGIDLARLVVARVGPKRQGLPLDPAEDRVELVLADEEAVVLRDDLIVGIKEVECDVVLDSDREERAPRRRAR